MQILNYGVYFTLDNGFESYTEIDGTTKEGLENGFIDIYEAIDINWLIEENEFDKDVCVQDWEIKRLPSEDITYLDMEKFNMTDTLNFIVDGEKFSFVSCKDFVKEFIQAYEKDTELSNVLYNEIERIDIGNQLDIEKSKAETVQKLYNVLSNLEGIE